jgi:hypothetical protein
MRQLHFLSNLPDFLALEESQADGHTLSSGQRFDQFRESKRLLAANQVFAWRWIARCEIKPKEGRTP